MSLTINTNILSLNAQRNLSKSQNKLMTSMERLSSGLRINSAKDDAAGLAIADRMTSQIRGLNQATRNAGDGISLAQTAEGAMQETTNIVQRIRELAVQSANDTNTASDRASLQAEVNQLKSEIDRIATTTSFNNQNILDGSFRNKQFQVGANAGETIKETIGRVASDNLGGGVVDEMNKRAHLGTGSCTPASASSMGSVNTSPPQTITVSTPDKTTDTSLIGHWAAVSYAEFLNNDLASSGVEASAENELIFDNLSASGIVTMTLFTEANLSTVSANVTGNSFENLIDAINSAYANQSLTAISHDGGMKLISGDGYDLRVQDFQNSSGGTADVTGLDGFPETLTSGGADSTVIHGKVILTSKCTPFTVSSNRSADDGGLFNTDANTSISTFISDIDVSTFEGASRAISAADGAICKIDKERGQLGALQNRFESTIANLRNISENLSAARSRILDADIAKETSAMTKQNILQQAGVSILTQANQQPQLALSLLGNL